jgi:hypothetical protein
MRVKRFNSFVSLFSQLRNFAEQKTPDSAVLHPGYEWTGSASTCFFLLGSADILVRD